MLSQAGQFPLSRSPRFPFSRDASSSRSHCIWSCGAKILDRRGAALLGEHRGEHHPHQRDPRGMSDSCREAASRFTARVRMGGTGLEERASKQSSTPAPGGACLVPKRFHHRVGSSVPGREKACVYRPFVERMMGLEPTTFCMARASDVRARSRPFAQRVDLQGFVSNERTLTPAVQYCARIGKRKVHHSPRR